MRSLLDREERDKKRKGSNLKLLPFAKVLGST
jgi:hypothetical protein